MKIIVVGQGIAGTLITHFLLEQHQEVVVIDPGKPINASKVAAGIINPITGRRFVKSWRVDEFMRFAKPMYRRIEQLLSVDLYHEFNLIRALNNNKQETEWLLRGTYPGYEQFMLDKAELGPYTSFVQPAYAWAELKGSAQVDFKKLVTGYRQLLKEKGNLIEEQLDHSQLDLTGESIHYKGVTADRIVFCEGYESRNNPLFSDLPHQPAKGDALLIGIPGLRVNKMLKSKTFLVPAGKELFWVGSNYEWDFTDDLPSPTRKQQLLETLSATLTVDFEVQAHLAAIRPVFKDRRPKVGPHKHYKQVYLFNGLGTKGASLAPFWANHLVSHLVEGTLLDADVGF